MSKQRKREKSPAKFAGRVGRIHLLLTLQMIGNWIVDSLITMTTTTASLFDRSLNRFNYFVKFRFYFLVIREICVKYRLHAVIASSASSSLFYSRVAEEDRMRG